MSYRTITPIAALFIGIVLCYTYLRPTYTDVVAVRENIARYNDALERYQSFSDILQKKLNTKRQHDVLENPRLEAFLPSETDTSQLFVDLKRIAESHRMLFGNIQATEPTESDLAASINGTTQNSERLLEADMTFEVIGTYEQFKDLLASIERAQPLFEVLSIKTQSVENSDFQQFSLKVRSYSLSHKQETIESNI